ncbi:hypothetical protein WJX73_007750 [Symbiochloris irregularis]|uniref:inorganic diphosphatase n=1 Tax=Symbiochloris irregularis TaxID=706552 RepID=A0AAW1NPL5_9CHLO
MNPAVGKHLNLHTSLSLGSSLKRNNAPSRQANIPSSPKVLSAVAGVHTRHASISDAPVDVSFRMYTYEAGKLNRVELPEDNLGLAAGAGDGEWTALMDPSAPAAQRDAAAVDLFGLPSGGLTSDPSLPKPLQKHYSGVYIMNPSTSSPAFTAKPSRFATREQGDSSTEQYRLFLQQEGKDVSSWHDIPLRNEDGSLNFVCEIPKETSAKFEVATGEAGNPIKQDMKKGKLRFYPYPINWNYGMLPQTWEDPSHSNDDLGGITGDNDPVDVVEIGSTQLASGGVYSVKAVGAYAMVDDGELDWKIICIRSDDPLASKINDVEDVEREMPGELEKIMVWFRDYKIPDGKPPNAFGYDNKPQNSQFAHQIIADTHGLYNQLKEGQRINDKNLALQ